MFMKLFLSVLTSEMTKRLIAFAIQKLLDAKGDGITKEVIVAVLDGAVESRHNDLTAKDIKPIKKALGE